MLLNVCNKIFQWNKRYFIINQQIARHFVHYFEYIYHSLHFYASQITNFNDLSHSRQRVEILANQGILILINVPLVQNVFQWKIKWGRNEFTKEFVFRRRFIVLVLIYLYLENMNSSSFVPEIIVQHCLFQKSLYPALNICKLEIWCLNNVRIHNLFYLNQLINKYATKNIAEIPQFLRPAVTQCCNSVVPYFFMILVCN